MGQLYSAKALGCSHTKKRGEGARNKQLKWQILRKGSSSSSHRASALSIAFISSRPISSERGKPFFFPSLMNSIYLILSAVSCLVFKNSFVCLDTLHFKSFLAVSKNSYTVDGRLWRGWTNSSVVTMHAVQAWNLSLDPQHSHKNYKPDRDPEHMQPQCCGGQGQWSHWDLLTVSEDSCGDGV